MQPMVKLAANASRGERRYVCFAGAGVSKDAGIPSAWDLMLKTAELLRARDDVDPDGRDIQTWFLESEYAEMRYDELIGNIYTTSVLQQDFLRGALRANEPGKAHRLIAELAKQGVFRCVITTNFDDLIERALREESLEVQVIASDDQLRSSEPLIHCKQFRVYKPHGTLGVGRLRNTPKDLEKLSVRMERELARVVSDHGLIVLGYSGADGGIRRVFSRRRQYLYPTFWLNPSEPAEDIPALCGTESFNYVPCKGASAGLSDLLAMYRKLDLMSPKTGLAAVAQAAQEAIRERRPDAPSRVSDFWDALIAELKAVDPNNAKEYGYGEFAQSLANTQPAALAFAEVSRTIAEWADESAAVRLGRGFSLLASAFHPPKGVGGYSQKLAFDFWKFVAHEMFVTMIAMLIREDRWVTIARLLGEEIRLENHPIQGFRSATFEYLSQTVHFLKDRSGGNNGAHAALLRDRHTEGELGRSVPLAEFTEADYLLALRSAALGSYLGDRFDGSIWLPWSVFFMRDVPRFLVDAEQARHAEQILAPLGVADVPALRSLLREHHALPTKLFGSYALEDVSQIDPEIIGTR